MCTGGAIDLFRVWSRHALFEDILHCNILGHPPKFLPLFHLADPWGSAVKMADAGKKERTFRKFTFRGVDLDQLLDLNTDELVNLFHARARRRFQRGLKRYIQRAQCTSGISLANPALEPYSRTQPSRQCEAHQLVAPLTAKPSPLQQQIC